MDMKKNLEKKKLEKNKIIILEIDKKNMLRETSKEKATDDKKKIDLKNLVTQMPEYKEYHTF
jgi:hypothetical protein